MVDNETLQRIVRGAEVIAEPRISFRAAAGEGHILIKWKKYYKTRETVGLRAPKFPTWKNKITTPLCFVFPPAICGLKKNNEKTLPSSPLPHHLSSSRYHIGQGLLIVPRQGEENGERKGIMTARGGKRGSERKEGQTGYYEREGWEQWRHLESLFAFLSLGLCSQSDWSIRPAM